MWSNQAVQESDVGNCHNSDLRDYLAEKYFSHFVNVKDSAVMIKCRVYFICWL